MKIVILDGHTANPGDLSWDGLREYGELEVYDRTAPAELLSRAEGAEVILTNKVIIDAKTMAALPCLRYIGVLATGYNVVLDQRLGQFHTLLSQPRPFSCCKYSELHVAVTNL